MNEPIFAAMLILFLLAVGELISIMTRARIPMLLVVLIGYLITLWTGIFPKKIIDSSTIGTFGTLMIAPLIVHMGTLVPFKIIKSQIRAVIIALCGVAVAAVLILAIITPMFGYSSAVAGTGPLTGGTIAFILTAQKLKAIGQTGLVTIPALILAIQSLIGMPLASFFLRRHAKHVKKTLNQAAYTEVAAAADPESILTDSKRKTWIPKKYQTHVILLLQLFIGGALAIFLGNLTGINYSLWALVIGLIGAYIGFYNDKMLERANSFGIAMVGIIVITMSSMNDVTIHMFVGYLPVVLAIMAIGIVGIIAGGFVGAKLMKWNMNKGIAVALTALFGFPGDYLLCEEISRSVADNEAEQKTIFNEILTPMLVGGFTTVTTASVIIASILVQTI
ncbi:hypothetical protein [Scopulibacillus cellulosilyticus]|uniref:Na+/glutamate symporter n=1 Tax=Scopulibacillus cellulosilyticus TaxID=2665665 RepID=A0ABW2Q1R3_9BACL